jgi:hypothetical protein
MPNSDEAFGQHMQEESAEELRCRKGHLPLFAPMGVVLPAEGDPLSIEGQEPVVGDGDPMGVPGTSQCIRKCQIKS